MTSISCYLKSICRDRGNLIPPTTIFQAQDALGLEIKAVTLLCAPCLTCCSGATGATGATGDFVLFYDTTGDVGTTGTSSSTFALIPYAQFVDPEAGVYDTDFTTSVTGTTGAVVSFEIYIGGVAQPQSLRTVTITNGGAYSAVAINGIFSVNGSQNIEVWWSVTGGSATVIARTLDIVLIAPAA